MKINPDIIQEKPQLIKSIGTLPETPPEKHFTSDKVSDDLDFDAEDLDIDEEFDVDSDLY